MMDSEDADMRYMALKAYIDENWANGGTEDYKIIIQGLRDGSVMVRDLASGLLVESFVQNEEVGTIYLLFHELCKDGSVQFAKALKTMLKTKGKGMIMVAYNVVEMYWKKLTEIKVQSIHLEVIVMMLGRYAGKEPLDAVFSISGIGWEWEDEGFKVLKAWIRHLTKGCVSEVKWFSMEQWVAVTDECYYKLERDCALTLMEKCREEINKEIVSANSVQILYNLRWFWVHDNNLEITALVNNIRSCTRDEGELEDVTDSDEFDIALSDDDDDDESSIRDPINDALEIELAKFDTFFAALHTMERYGTRPVVTQRSESRLYHELLLDLSNKQLLEQWLKQYQDYDLSLTTSLIYQTIESDFTLFQWQWVMTILEKLPTRDVISIISPCIPFLKPLKRFIQIIQVGNLKQRQDDSINLRLQLWSLIESLLDLFPQSRSTTLSLSLQLLHLLRAIIPYLQYGLNDSLKEPNFQPVLLSILQNLASNCDPIIVLQPSLLQDLLSFPIEDFPWIVSAMDTIRYKML